MNIGFDVDGVIAKGILKLDKLLRHQEKIWNRLLLNPLGKFLYRNFRRPDKEVKKLMYCLKAQGHQIIIATYAFRGNEKVVLEWLKRHEIPCDKVFLSREGETPLEFKVRVILEEGCDYFVEDQFSLARGIALRTPGAQVIHYRKKEDLGVLLS